MIHPPTLEPWRSLGSPAWQSWRRDLRRRYGWRWWRQVRHKGQLSYLAHRSHQHPHVGRRRLSTTRYLGLVGEWQERRHRRGRPARLVEPAIILTVMEIEAGPYVEEYAEYQMAPWWKRRILAARTRRGAYPWRRLQWPHPLQRKR